MPRLQQLELIVLSGGSSNLLEGNQWEIFIKKHLPFLSIFNLKFKIINIDRNNYNEKTILAQFSSSFWLNRNPSWYVAYNIDDFIIYTIPCFVPCTIKHSLLSILPHSTTLPVEQYFIYYNQINELELDSNNKSSYRYTNVQRLILSITTIDENIIDLSKVEYLCVQSLSWSLKKLFQIIKTSMTNLYHLKLDFNFSVIQLSDIDPLEQIRILDLPQFSFSLNNNNNIDLSSLFPCVERLTIKIHSLNQMSHIIDQFIYLSSGSFHMMDDHNVISHMLTETDTIYKWLIENTNRLATDRSFTYRLDSRSDIWVHLWITSESSPPKKVLKKTLPGEQFMELKEPNGRYGDSSRCCSLQ
ncbi:unnamed protein product [Rotaria sp. Silwood1]|nr:unnamed protein product [Rotaria sp. Silwood1]CAF1099545.1 unnamed protein product [Rotaria sp. Silwood1]CAF3424813.1 unnamed protein product [Rotaria sp. Silwood1]CAF3448791.1 unnamed protein product [Rotaria sp. Silwood1]CAF3469588.1 unnamed protein product [Rotaria sp. Silwood1]